MYVRTPKTRGFSYIFDVKGGRAIRDSLKKYPALSASSQAHAAVRQAKKESLTGFWNSNGAVQIKLFFQEYNVHMNCKYKWNILLNVTAINFWDEVHSQTIVEDLKSLIGHKFCPGDASFENRFIILRTNPFSSNFGPMITQIGWRRHHNTR